VGSPCLNGGTCTATSWQTFTCNCPTGVTGTTCASGALGTNFYQVSSTTGFSSSNGNWAAQSLTVAPPFSKFDWTVALVFIPVSTCSSPGDLEMFLKSPNGYSMYPTMSGIYNLKNCNSLNVPLYDNNTVIWGSSSQTAVCGASTITPYSNGYQDTGGNWHCFSGSGCTFASQSGTFVSDPFAQTFQMGGGTVAGTWQLQLYDANSCGISSWTLQFYRSCSCLPQLLTSANFFLFLFSFFSLLFSIRGMHQQSMRKRGDLYCHWLGSWAVLLHMCRWLHWDLLPELGQSLH